MVLFCQAEKEADRPLQFTYTCSESHIIPYVFATGHHSYARYGLYYFRSSEAMLDEICRQFLQGEHVTRHIAEPGTGCGQI